MKRQCTFFLILIGVFLSTSIYALDVNAGMDREACANKVLTLGGMPTAENGLAPYTYKWTSTSGFTSSEANPEYLLPPTVKGKSNSVQVVPLSTDLYNP